MFYSKLTNGFYITEIHGNNMPDDVVSITVEEHQALMDGQSNRQEITSDANGFPILTIRVINNVELTPAEKLANAGLSVDELKQLLGL